MALNTCEASTLPDEQALPELTATPARSSPMTKVSALVPGTAMQLVLGKRSTLPRQHHSLGHEPQSLRLKLIAKRGKLGGPLRFRRGELRRNAEADDAGDILSPRPPPPLLAAALDQGLDRRTLTEQESADSLWTADLVRRKRHHVGAKRAEFQRQPASDLNRIAMQKTTGGVNEFSGLSDRLDRASLVICRHQRNEGSPSPKMVFRKLFLKRSKVDNAVA